VEDGTPGGHGHVAAIAGRVGLFEKCGEANLVVDDNVDGVVSLVIREGAKAKGFPYRSLEHGRVSMEKDGHHFTSCLYTPPVLIPSAS
jgi:hypothetical protein